MCAECMYVQKCYNPLSRDKHTHLLSLCSLSIHRDYTIALGALPTLTPPTMCGRAAVAARQAATKHFT